MIIKIAKPAIKIIGSTVVANRKRLAVGAGTLVGGTILSNYGRDELKVLAKEIKSKGFKQALIKAKNIKGK